VVAVVRVELYLRRILSQQEHTQSPLVVAVQVPPHLVLAPMARHLRLAQTALQVVAVAEVLLHRLHVTGALVAQVVAVAVHHLQAQQAQGLQRKATTVAQVRASLVGVVAVEVDEVVLV
jgi:hypothetical protein